MGVKVGVAVDCGWAIDLEVSVSVGVAGEELVAEQPLAPSTSSVSQVTKMQREKDGKRDSDTMVDTSYKVLPTFIENWPDFLPTAIIAHLDKLGYFGTSFPLTFTKVMVC